MSSLTWTFCNRIPKGSNILAEELVQEGLEMKSNNVRMSKPLLIMM
jgi:hypothetical protein